MWPRKVRISIAVGKRSAVLPRAPTKAGEQSPPDDPSPHKEHTRGCRTSSIIEVADRLAEERRKINHIRPLEALGYNVTLTPAA